MSDAPAAPPPPPGKRISFALAVLMHVVLVIFIVYGIHWQTQKPATVTVDLVSAVPPAPAPVAETKPEPPPQPKPEPRPEPKPEPRPEPKPEPVKPPPKPDIAQKEKEKPKPIPPKPEPKAEPQKPAPDPFQEQLKRESEQLQQKKVADANKAAADKELADLKAKQASTALAGEVDKYISAIRGKVRGNIVLPPDIKGNPEAVFEVTQLPSGEILTVKLTKSSGNAGWDVATERAIHKSSPLPKPPRSELFSRTLELRFRPQED